MIRLFFFFFNFSTLLRTYCFGILFFSTVSVFGQPNSFTISGCSSISGAANGSYTRSATDVNGCPCYEKADNTAVYFRPSGNSWAYSSGSCTAISAGELYTYNGGCDIAIAGFGNCDPAATLINIQYPSGVPTLSEWGLIILALLLMTLGTVYLVQPNWRGRFEQK